MDGLNKMLFRSLSKQKWHTFACLRGNTEGEKKTNLKHENEKGTLLGPYRNFKYLKRIWGIIL